MATAYAALVSLTHLIEQSIVHNACQPVFSHKQRRQIKFLQKKVSFLQDFLEVHSHGGFSNESESLESRIADATHAVEDIIESNIVDSILSQAQENGSKKTKNENIRFTNDHGEKHFSQGMQKVIENVVCIAKEVMQIKESRRVHNRQPHNLVPVVLSRPPPAGKDTMVRYYDDELIQIMDKLTGQSSNLQIIAIVGMGGIGKTTLAKNVYDNSLILEKFYIRAWVTISQECSLEEMLLTLLDEIRVPSNKREHESLGEKLHKHLSGRKYLIVMDDLWSIEAWEKLKLFLPDNGNGSRVIVTTRLSSVAESFGSSHLYKMNLLNEDKSWNLLCNKVFDNVSCPLELEEIGKDIAKNCKGLPLSIVVIGGLLAKSEMTRKYWEYVAEDISHIVNSVDDMHWLKIFSLSYSHLPIHLKPCFLYMGVYPEDCKIRVSKLIKLWVAEGFLKLNKAKSVEEVGEDYLKDLIDRNLISVCEWGSTGRIKTCCIHDLLRDLCLKEARKEMFLSVIKVQNHEQHVNSGRRAIFHEDWSNEIDSREFERALQSTQFTRSLTCYSQYWSSSWVLVPDLRLLRVLNKASTNSFKSILQLVNLRYLRCDLHLGASADLSPMCRLWCLQTLILTGFWMEIIAPIEIWEMPQLRHIISQYGICLPNPLRGRIDGQDDHASKNILTLSCIKNFTCTEDVLERIPNIKKLSIRNEEMGNSNDYCLHNLGRIHKLQSLDCTFFGDTDFFQKLAFSQSLKKLSLCCCHFDWDDFTTKVGSLPHLEKLKLAGCFTGAEWNTVEGKFFSLKFLQISNIRNLVYWTAESSHFPLLDRLVLRGMRKLKEIPSGIGETLQSIELVACGKSIMASAKEILEEQQSQGNEVLRLIVHDYHGFAQ